MANLYRVTSFYEFISIAFLHFVKRKFDPQHSHLHRLLIFATACADKNIMLSEHTRDLILVEWKENETPLKMIVRKYSRDLMVFSEMFLEEGYLSHAKHMAKKNDVLFVLDAGANIGCTVIFLSTYFPNARIICIEPEVSNFDLLGKNVQLNGLSKRVTCLNKAVWNVLTRLDLRQRDWSSDAYHVMSKTTADEVISTTETITISKIMEDYQVRKIDFLKMDIEGAEKVLFEDEEQLKEYLSHTSQLALEVHEEFISTVRIGTILEKFGFGFKVVPESGESAFIMASKIEPF